MSQRSLNRRRQREFDRIRETLLFQGEQEDVADRMAISRVSRDLPATAEVDDLAMVAQIRSRLTGQPSRSLRSVDSDDDRWSRGFNRRTAMTGPGRGRRLVISGASRASSPAHLA